MSPFLSENLSQKSWNIYYSLNYVECLECNVCDLWQIYVYNIEPLIDTKIHGKKLNWDEKLRILILKVCNDATLIH